MSLRRVYETTFIVNAALEDQDVEAVISKVGGYIENNGGEILETNKWGRRRLAYPINKKYNGYYVHLSFDSKPSFIPLLDRFLVLEDTVLRHLTLILPKKLRDYRAKVALQHGKPYDATIYDLDNKADESKSKENEEVNEKENEIPAGEPVLEADTGTAEPENSSAEI